MALDMSAAAGLPPKRLHCLALLRCDLLPFGVMQAPRESRCSAAGKCQCKKIDDLQSGKTELRQSDGALRKDGVKLYASTLRSKKGKVSCGKCLGTFFHPECEKAHQPCEKLVRLVILTYLL